MSKRQNKRSQDNAVQEPNQEQVEQRLDDQESTEGSTEHTGAAEETSGAAEGEAIKEPATEAGEVTDPPTE